MRSTTDSYALDDATERAHAGKKSKRKRIKQSRIPAEDFRAIMLANARFYSAFSSLDLTAMGNCWLEDSRCICHFPGMKRLTSKAKIMKSFRYAVDEMDGAIRRNWMEPTEIQIEFQTSEKATVFCQELVYSICCSVVEGELRPESELIQKLSATNGFKKVEGKWYLWYHQASAMGDSAAEFHIEKQAVDAPTENNWQQPPSPKKTTNVPSKPLQPPAHSYSEMTMSETFDTAAIENEERKQYLDCTKYSL